VCVLLFVLARGGGKGGKKVWVWGWCLCDFLTRLEGVNPLTLFFLSLWLFEYFSVVLTMGEGKKSKERMEGFGVSEVGEESLVVRGEGKWVWIVFCVLGCCSWGLS